MLSIKALALKNISGTCYRKKEFVGSLSAEEKIVRGSIEVEMVLRLPIGWRKFMGSLEP